MGDGGGARVGASITTTVEGGVHHDVVSDFQNTLSLVKALVLHLRET